MVKADPFFAGPEVNENENEDERRLRMTKKLLNELKEE